LKVSPQVSTFLKVSLITNHIILTTMNANKLHIRFIVNKRRLNAAGNTPIKCRLTYNKNRKDFSTGITVNPDHWNPKKQRLLDHSDQEETTNMQLSLIENKISKAFLMLQIGEEPFTVQDIYNQFKGKSLKKDMGLWRYGTCTMRE